MTSRSGLAWPLLTLVLAGCPSPQGKVLVTIIFENETRTRCLKTTASKAGGADISSNPAALPRAGKDTLQIGLAETPDLIGEVDVTIARFASDDCTGMAFATETKPTTIVHGGPVAHLEFRFVGMGGTDGGADGGVDGGVDAGCNLSACPAPASECQRLPATACLSDGGCAYTAQPAQRVCDAGVCNSGGVCIANVCAVLAAGAPCDDGLDCTASSTCGGGQCSGFCAAPPACNAIETPVSCNPAALSECKLVASNNFTSCQPAPGGQCLDGGCVPWLQFSPLNFPPLSASLAVTPYPTDAWALASPDGGLCDTVISTSGTPSVLQGDCGSPVLTSMVDDAGVLVLTTRGLDVGPNARLSFVGTRPVQLVVIGNATINGVVSVAPLIPNEPPAGTGSSACGAAVAGNSSKEGGGGGGFGEVGGRGGESGGNGGTRTATTVPLRGGCPGAAGFGSTPGGLGGGAIELIVADALTLNGGVVTASGGGGAQGALDGEGGGGGGSGGTVIIEARTVNLNGGAVTSNGGGGGEGGGVGDGGVAGSQGSLASATSPPEAENPSCSGGAGGIGGDSGNGSGLNGQNGSSSAGGGGGGGGVGVIFIRGSVSCTRGTGVISGGQPTPFTCN